MVKKKYLCGAVIIFILLVVVLLFFLYNLQEKDYISILKDNWNIALPVPVSENFIIDHNVAPLGDGEYYTILKYDDSQVQEILNSVEWNSKVNEEFKNNVQALFKQMKVDKKYEINFSNNNLYYFQEKEDNSKIYIVWSMEESLMFILEDIY